MTIPRTAGKYGLRHPELPAKTRVRHFRDGRTGSVAWLCPKQCYRILWDDGSVTTTHETQLVAEGQS